MKGRCVLCPSLTARSLEAFLDGALRIWAHFAGSEGGHLGCRAGFVLARISVSLTCNAVSSNGSIRKTTCKAEVSVASLEIPRTHLFCLRNVPGGSSNAFNSLARL